MRLGGSDESDVTDVARETCAITARAEGHDGDAARQLPHRVAERALGRFRRGRRPSSASERVFDDGSNHCEPSVAETTVYNNYDQVNEGQSVCAGRTYAQAAS